MTQGAYREEASVQGLDPLAFDALVGDLLAAMGYQATLTKRSHGGGVDVDAINPEPIKGGRLVVQCKRYTGTIGVSAVRELYGVVMDKKVAKGILITTSNFSADALRFAQDKPIDLINGQQLVGLLRERGLLVAALPAMDRRQRVGNGLAPSAQVVVVAPVPARQPGSEPTQVPVLRSCLSVAAVLILLLVGLLAFLVGHAAINWGSLSTAPEPPSRR